MDKFYPSSINLNYSFIIEDPSGNSFIRNPYLPK